MSITRSTTERTKKRLRSIKEIIGESDTKIETINEI